MRKSKAKEIENAVILYNRVPGDFIDFVSDSLEKIMFYHKEDKKTYKGYCSCGAEDIPLEKPKSGQYIVCPHCNQKVKLKNDAYKGANHLSKVCTYVDRLNDGYIQIIYIANQKIEYSPSASPRVKVTVGLNEEQRDYFTDELKFYQFHPLYQYKMIEGGLQKSGKYLKGRAHKHGMGWNGWYSEDMQMLIYPYNLDQIIKDDEQFKYSCLRLFAEKVGYNPLWYLSRYRIYPQVEKLLKVGLYKIAFQLIDYENNYYYSNNYRLNKSGQTIEAICGLKTKKDLEIASKFDLDLNQINALLIMNKWKSEITFERIKFLAALILHSGNDFEYQFISNEKLCLYYEKNKGKRSPREFITDYTDYITAAIALKMDVNDTKVKTPHDFTYCHDICLARYEQMKEKNRQKKERLTKRKLEKKLKQFSEIFSCTGKKYSIVVPLSESDLKKEGEQNKNCVGGYKDRIVDDCSIVLFLRETKNIDESFCTVELKPKTYEVLQCRSKGNGPAPEPAKRWLEKQIEIIKSKMKAA